MDFIIDELVIEEDRPEHLAKHDVRIEEVLEIVDGDYVFIEGKLGRWLLIGKTKKNRFLTVVVGSRRQKNTYGLVTARPSSREERSFYKRSLRAYALKEFTFEKGVKEMVKVKKIKRGSIKPIAPFKTLEEEANFWDSHSAVDKIDKGTIVGFHQANKTGTITIRFQPEYLQILREKAFERGIGPTTLARMWLIEKLRQTQTK